MPYSLGGPLLPSSIVGFLGQLEQNLILSSAHQPLLTSLASAKHMQGVWVPLWDVALGAGSYPQVL